MNKKQKNTLMRILLAAVLLVALMIPDHAGVFDSIPELVRFALYFIPYIIVGYDVIRSAFRNIIRGNAFEEHFLMSIATLAAFALGLLGKGEYPEAVSVMLLYQIGELFQSYAVGKSRQSITKMMELAPEYANLIHEDGTVEKIDPDDVECGSMILVRPGEKIPIDGVVEEGESFIDTAALTGEPVPRRVRRGDEVISGCVNRDAALNVRTTKEYEDSTVSRILDLVENASSKKARLENFITRFARYYTPAVTIGAVVLALLLPVAFHVSWVEGIRRACNFLIVSCPCALVISVPLGFFGGIGAASKIGVLVKGSNYLEAAARMTTLVMDKTGTLTKGEFRVSQIRPAKNSGLSEKDLLRMAAYGESRSSHPIAQSIEYAYREQSKDAASGTVPVTGMSEIAGRGIRADYDGKTLLLGNGKLMDDEHIAYEPCRDTGTVVYIAYDHAYAGCIVISDSVKEGAAEAVSELKRNGVRRVVMLTGDRKETAQAIASEIGIDEIRAELLPQDKVSEVEHLIQEETSGGGKVGFVGDGINDAPVLMRSDVGFAMGSLGSDAAIEAADIVIMDDDIRKIPKTVKIARRTMAIVKSNIAFALIVKAVILVLSAVGLASMWAAVFGDVGVSIICVLNSMRALRR